MGKGQITIGPAIIIAALTLGLSVTASLVAASNWKGTTAAEVTDLKAEQMIIREAIKPIPFMQADLEWIKNQLGKIAIHIGAPEAKK